MKTSILLILLFLFVNCNQQKNQSVTEEDSATKFEMHVPDNSIDNFTDYDLYNYTYKQKLTDLLSLNALENGTDSFELRFWKAGSRIDPVILYILKKSPDTNWSMLHYQLFRGGTGNSENPEIDSLVVEKVWPRMVSWEKYISSLKLDSLWTTPSQREVVDDFVVVGGYSYLIELATSKKYRFLSYYAPDVFQDVEPNHHRIIEFQKNLREGIMYNVISNP